MGTIKITMTATNAQGDVMTLEAEAPAADAYKLIEGMVWCLTEFHKQPVAAGA